MDAFFLKYIMEGGIEFMDDSLTNRVLRFNNLFLYLFRMGIDDHIALSGLTLKLDSMGGHPENIHRYC